MEEHQPPAAPKTRSHLQRAGAIVGSLALSAFGSGIALLVFIAWPAPAPFKMVGVDHHYALVNPDGILIEAREFEMLRTSTLTVHRQLTRMEGKVELRLHMPTTQTRYLEGKHVEHRLQGIPLGLPPGQYDLHNEFCWSAALKLKCQTMPRMQVAINGYSVKDD